MKHIVVLKKEKVEDGTHDDLLHKKAAYYDIFNAMASSLNFEKIIDLLEEEKLIEKIEKNINLSA